VDIHEKWETEEREMNLVSRLSVVDVSCGMGDDAVEKCVHWYGASDVFAINTGSRVAIACTGYTPPTVVHLLRIN
jgi:hypothetical protein